MTRTELTALIRDHATKTADPEKNGWDHISEFLSDDDIAHELAEGNCTTGTKPSPTSNRSPPTGTTTTANPRETPAQHRGLSVPWGNLPRLGLPPQIPVARSPQE